MRFHGSTLMAAAAWLYFTTLSADETTASTSRPEYSVLTPAMAAEFTVSSTADPASAIPFLVNATDLTHRSQTAKLRNLVAAERYDAARPIADRLIDALAEAGHVAVYEPIRRPPAGKQNSLSWSDLPESPQGGQLLDLTIGFICFCQTFTGLDYFPALSLDWRILDSRQAVVVEPTRTLVYLHSPAWNGLIYSPTKRKFVQPSADAPKYPPVTVSESCQFNKLEEALENSTRLWECFGEAYDVAVKRLVIDLDRARSRHHPITASGGTPSGTSMR